VFAPPAQPVVIEGENTLPGNDRERGLATESRRRPRLFPTRNLCQTWFEKLGFRLHDRWMGFFFKANKNKIIFIKKTRRPQRKKAPIAQAFQKPPWERISNRGSARGSFLLFATLFLFFR